jgi:hypothetical protein
MLKCLHEAGIALLGARVFILYPNSAITAAHNGTYHKTLKATASPNLPRYYIRV